MYCYRAFLIPNQSNPPHWSFVETLFLVALDEATLWNPWIWHCVCDNIFVFVYCYIAGLCCIVLWFKKLSQCNDVYPWISCEHSGPPRLDFQKRQINNERQAKSSTHCYTHCPIYNSGQLGSRVRTIRWPPSIKHRLVGVGAEHQVLKPFPGTTPKLQLRAQQTKI